MSLLLIYLVRSHVYLPQVGPVNIETYKRYTGNSWNTLLNLRNEAGFTLDVQLIPVLNHTNNKFLVPKPLAESPHVWRFSDLKAERELTERNEIAMNVVRFLIKFCRMQVQSYSIQI